MSTDEEAPLDVCVLFVLTLCSLLSFSFPLLDTIDHAGDEYEHSRRRQGHVYPIFSGKRLHKVASIRCPLAMIAHSIVLFGTTRRAEPHMAQLATNQLLSSYPCDVLSPRQSSNCAIDSTPCRLWFIKSVLIPV